VTARVPTASGALRLLNTADGRVLCLAGDVDEVLVDAFLQQYGPEPARIDGIDGGSVTSLSASAAALVRDHLELAWLAGRRVTLRGPHVAALVAEQHPTSG
jgi:hypothetical protein